MFIANKITLSKSSQVTRGVNYVYTVVAMYTIVLINYISIHLQIWYLVIANQDVSLYEHWNFVNSIFYNTKVIKFEIWGEIFNKFSAINIFWGLFKDVEKTFPVPAGDEYGLEVKVCMSFCTIIITQQTACILFENMTCWYIYMLVQCGFRSHPLPENLRLSLFRSV